MHCQDWRSMGGVLREVGSRVSGPAEPVEIRKWRFLINNERPKSGRQKGLHPFTYLFLLLAAPISISSSGSYTLILHLSPASSRPFPPCSLPLPIYPLFFPPCQDPAFHRGRVREEGRVSARNEGDINDYHMCDYLSVQLSPLIWSTDVRSTRLYGQFLAGPNHRTLILISNPDIRSARLYGQFSLDKTLTLQAGSTVLSTVLVSVGRPNILPQTLQGGTSGFYTGKWGVLFAVF